MLSTLNNFNGIYTITEKQTNKEKGDLFELFTYYLFKHDPRLNNNLEKIWLYADVPQKVLQYLKYPTKDKGIDLIAKIDCKYYAIQCKFRQKSDTKIPWNELSTFFGLSFGITNKIAGGFFVTNTRNLCQQVIDSDFVVPIYDDYYDSIPQNFFKHIADNKINYQEKYPLDHQIKCKTSAFMHFCMENNNRGYINMACGTGKSLTAYWINEEIASMKTVVFVPSLYLLSQFYTDWVNQSHAEGKRIKYLLVGSDADVGETDYINNGLILSTDPEEIKSYLKEPVIVVICTYQSADKLAEACGKKIKFDLGIFDEAHKTVGQKGKQFSRMLTNKHMYINKRLFMTATPKDYIGDNNDIIGMNDESIYGECIYTYNTGQAILDKRLTDYRILSIDATKSSIKFAINQNKLVKFKDEFDDSEAYYLGTILVLLKKFHDGTINHLITYHNAVSKAKKFAEFLEKINGLMYTDEILVASIDGSDSMKSRKNTIREFSQATKAIICSSKVLNEGVNIPIIDSVCFVDNRESTNDIIQCIGRGLRLFLGKNLAYVIIPTFIDDFETDNFDKNIFENIIKILKTLKNTDERIVEYFQLKFNGGVNNKRGPELIIRETYEEVSIEIDLKKWSDCIDCKIFNIIDKWMHRYIQVKKWTKENNKIPSPASNDPMEKMLGSWCTTQRQNYVKNNLTYKQIKLLNEICPYWYWNSDQKWEIKYLKVIQWLNDYKKFPSTKSKNSSEKILGMWCIAQRVNKIKGVLSDDYIKKLEKIQGWHWSLHDLWYSKFLELKEWVNLYNRIPSSTSKNLIEKTLGLWCARQRVLYITNKLVETKIKILDTIRQWYWSPADMWKKIYLRVMKWIKMNNNKKPSETSTDPIEKSLAGWMKTQKKKKVNNKLSIDQLKLLEKIGI